MSDGIRITQAGSTRPRTTQDGHRRITERAVMMGAVMTAAPVMGAVQFVRKRSMGAVMQAACGMSAALRGKVTLGASLQAAGSMGASGLRARRGMGTVMSATAQIYPGLGRVRPLCVQMDAAVDMDLNVTRQRTIGTALVAGGAVEFTVIKKTHAHLALAANTSMSAGDVVPLQRQRNVQVGLSATASMADVFLRKRAFVSTHMSTMPTVAFGRDDTGSYRLLEDGQRRVTQAGNRRLIEESFSWGHIIVQHPPFKIFHNAGGLWFVLTPSAKHASAWQLPQSIRVHWQGGWRDVKSNK